MPGLRRLLAVRHPDVIGFCLSGAGPSIAAFTTGPTAAVEEIFRDVYRKERIACTVRAVRVQAPSTRLRAGPSTKLRAAASSAGRRKGNA